MSENVNGRRAVLQAIDPALEHALPPLIGSDQPAGTLQESTARALGLNEKVLVSAGGGDNMMGAIGTGNTVAGVVTASFGTSGTIYACAESPVIDSARRNRRLLRLHQSLAASALHHERHRRHRNGARGFRHDPRAIRRRSRQSPRRLRRAAAPAVSGRRAHAQCSARHRRLVRRQPENIHRRRISPAPRWKA